jgi:two-component sensor histidine kinase
MAGIRANITIDLPDGEDFSNYIQQIQAQISRVSGLKTSISVRDIDDPISLNPKIAKKVSTE